METGNPCALQALGAWTVGGLGLLCLVVAFEVPTPVTPLGQALAGAAGVLVSAAGAAYLLNGQLLGRRLPAGVAWGAAAGLTVWALGLGRLALWQHPEDQLVLAFVPLLPAAWVIAACHPKNTPPGS